MPMPALQKQFTYHSNGAMADLAKGGEDALQSRLIHVLWEIGHIELGVVVVVQAGAWAAVKAARAAPKSWLRWAIRTDPHHQCSAVHHLHSPPEI